MITLFYGPDSYRRTLRVRELTAAFAKKHPAGLVERFDLETDGELERFTAFCHNQSLFAKAKLAIVTDLGEVEKPKTLLLKTIATDKETSVLILSDKKPVKEYAFLFKEPNTIEEFEQPEGARLVAFIEREAKARGAALSASEARALAVTSGGDSWTIITELEKIALGAAVEDHTSAPAFFPLVQTLKGRGLPSQKLVALAYLLDSEDPAAVFNITASMSDGEQKIAMADYDLAIKSGKLEYAEALTDLALRG